MFVDRGRTEDLDSRNVAYSSFPRITNYLPFASDPCLRADYIMLYLPSDFFFFFWIREVFGLLICL